MKNVKMGLIALVSVLGVGSAFTNAPKTVKSPGTSYFAVTNGAGSFKWTLNKPRATCETSTTSYCTIVTNGTGYVPTNGQAPNFTECTTPDPGPSRYN